MIVSALDKDDDWTFGRGRKNYITGSTAITQKAKCRVRSFKNDNPLNMDDNIDWINLMSEKKHRAGNVERNRTGCFSHRWRDANSRTLDDS